MLFTVSTVKETVAGLERFVRRNLAGGVDHLLVFLEDADPDAVSWAAAHAHVTAVVTDDAWWGGHRPPQLNARQKINANLARTALAADHAASHAANHAADHARDRWLWHLDGDEVLQVDRAALAALPESATVVHAPPLEAVSRPAWPDHRVTWFKRLLDEDDLVLLRVLGVLDRPVNEAYFHGHTRGKSGMRPDPRLWFTLHEVTDDAENDLAPYDVGDAPPVATLLHYESWSGEEFARKWTNILASGHLPAMRGNRQSTAVALRALGRHDLPADVLRTMVERIYAATTEDDLDTLRDLGLLVPLDPDAGTHRPEPLAEDARERLTAFLDAFAGLDKRPLRAGESAVAAAALVEQAAASGDGGLSPSGRTRGLPWRRGGR